MSLNAKVKIGFPITGKPWEYVIVEATYRKRSYYGWLHDEHDERRRIDFSGGFDKVLEHNETAKHGFDFYHVADIPVGIHQEPARYSGISNRAACALALAQTDISEVASVFHAAPIILVSCNCDFTPEGQFSGALLAPVSLHDTEEDNRAALMEKWTAASQAKLRVMGLVLYYRDAALLARALYKQNVTPPTIPIESLNVDDLRSNTACWPALIIVEKYDLPILAKKLGANHSIFERSRRDEPPPGMMRRLFSFLRSPRKHRSASNSPLNTYNQLLRLENIQSQSLTRLPPANDVWLSSSIPPTSCNMPSDLPANKSADDISHVDPSNTTSELVSGQSYAEPDLDIERPPEIYFNLPPDVNEIANIVHPNLQPGNRHSPWYRKQAVWLCLLVGTAGMTLAATGARWMGGRTPPSILRLPPDLISSPDLGLEPLLLPPPDLVTAPAPDLLLPLPLPPPPPLPGTLYEAPGGNMIFVADDSSSPRIIPFLLDQTEVTVEAYAECVKAGQCDDLSQNIAAIKKKPKGAFLSDRCNWQHQAERPRHPINCLLQPQAEKYCKHVGKRLPEDDELHFAAVGATGWHFPWGNEEPEPYKDICWFRRETTCVVDDLATSKDKSPFGILGLAGNVAEWTNTPPPADVAQRLFRGGNYATDTVKQLLMQHDPEADGIISRKWGLDSGAQNTIGVRCAGDANLTKTLRRLQ